MAKFIPSMPDTFNGSKGEEKAFEALRLLDNQYIVFHSFSWIGLSSRTQGEADFVIVHPEKGIMVIEVKAGEIEYKDGKWIQTNTLTRHAKVVSPFDQANKSKFEILERLKVRTRLGRPPLVCHAVWFPSITIKPKDILPPEAPKEIIFDETTLNRVKQAVDNCFEYWKNKMNISTAMNSKQLKETMDIMAPYFRVVPGMKGVIEEAEQQYIRLTNQQAMILEYLKEQKTAVIHGLAGTGKTVLAKEKARMLAHGEENVLFLCYNSFLKEHLRKQFSQPGITYHNAHSLAMEILDDEAIGIDELVEEFENYLIEVFEPEDWPYNHVVIDEGQDLNERLVNRLYELIKSKGGSFYVFYDKNQYVMKNDIPKWVEEAECRLVLHRNCRNTAEIFKTACSMISVDSDISEIAVRGETPMAIFVKDQSELLAAADKFVKNAIDSGIEPEEIVFLTVETEHKSLMTGVKSIRGIGISNDRADGSILFTTARKFKGLEAKAIMLIDVSIRGLTNSEKQRLAYVGCSRAKHILNIAVLDDIPVEDFGGFLRKINSSRNVPKNRKGFGRLLNLQINK